MSKLGKDTATTDDAIIELKVAAEGVTEATILKMLKDEPERIIVVGDKIEDIESPNKLQLKSYER